VGFGRLKHLENARFTRDEFGEVDLENYCREMGLGMLGLKIEEKSAQ
jgi:hypothetical protein